MTLFGIDFTYANLLIISITAMLSIFCILQIMILDSITHGTYIAISALVLAGAMCHNLTGIAPGDSVMLISYWSLFFLVSHDIFRYENSWTYSLAIIAAPIVMFYAGYADIPLRFVTWFST